jgi:hypothetical protein
MQCTAMSPNTERFQPPKPWIAIGTGMGTRATRNLASRLHGTSSPVAASAASVICPLPGLAGVALADKGRVSIRVTTPHPRNQFKTAIVFQSLVRQRENFFLTEKNFRYCGEHWQLPGYNI